MHTVLQVMWDEPKHVVLHVSSQMKTLCAGSRLALLLKHADRTLQHKPLSTTEGQGVALMNLEALTEIRGDSINSGHIYGQKS